MTKMGRPSTYDHILAQEMLDRIAQGESVRSICRKKKYPPYPTFARWLTNEGTSDFREQYQRARQLQADYHIEETIDIADQAVEDVKALLDPRHSSAIAKITTDRIRARQWKAARLHPNHWGDKMTMDVTAQVKVLKPDSIKKSKKKAGLGVKQDGKKSKAK